jgi:hypothetical protein
VYEYTNGIRRYSGCWWFSEFEVSFPIGWEAQGRDLAAHFPGHVPNDIPSLVSPFSAAMSSHNNPENALEGWAPFDSTACSQLAE